MKTFIKLLVGVGFLGVLAAGWLARAFWITQREMEAHLRIIRTVNSALGFAYETPYEDGDEILVISSVEPGGLMERAGLRVDDRPGCSIASLYERIVFGQGRDVAIPVRRAGHPVVVTVRVPALNLADDPRELHWYFTKHRE
jgi:S1-C subfamily serine protease